MFLIPALYSLPVHLRERKVLYQKKHLWRSQERNRGWLKDWDLGTSLAVQWLKLHASNAGGAGSIPDWWTKIPHAVRRSQEIKKKEKDWDLLEDYGMFFLFHTLPLCSSIKKADYNWKSHKTQCVLKKTYLRWPKVKRGDQKKKRKKGDTRKVWSLWHLEL